MSGSGGETVSAGTPSSGVLLYSGCWEDLGSGEWGRWRKDTGDGRSLGDHGLEMAAPQSRLRAHRRESDIRRAAHCHDSSLNIFARHEVPVHTREIVLLCWLQTLC